MSKIAIVYWSGTGNTEAMANLVAEGVTAAGGQADLLTPELFDAGQVDQYAAFAFGCPSMGAEQLEEAEFEPMFTAVKPGRAGKTGGLSGPNGGGAGEGRRTGAADCEDAGCNLADEPVIACGAPEGDAADACRALGRTLAS